MSIFGDSGGGDIINQIRNYYNMVSKRLGEHQANGFFNEQSRVAQIDRDYKEAGKIGGENLAGAMGIAGYRKGDSEVGVRQTALQNRLLERREESILNARQQAMQMELGWLGAANPSSMSSLMPYTQKPGLGSILKSVAPFIPGPHQAGGQSTQSTGTSEPGGQTQVTQSTPPPAATMSDGSSAPTPAIQPATGPRKPKNFEIEGFGRF